MNGTGRLYRSTSTGMLGGVCAGLGQYLNIDPIVLRLGFAVLTFATGGAFSLIYFALWLLLPTAAGTTTDMGSIIRENLNEMSDKVRNFTGAQNRPSGPAVDANALPQGVAPNFAGATTRPRANGAAMLLIGLGIFFLVANLGIFRFLLHAHMLWPLLLIGLGVMMLRRR